MSETGELIVLISRREHGSLWQGYVTDSEGSNSVFADDNVASSRHGAVLLLDSVVGKALTFTNGTCNIRGIVASIRRYKSFATNCNGWTYAVVSLRFPETEKEKRLLHKGTLIGVPRRNKAMLQASEPWLVKSFSESHLAMVRGPVVVLYGSDSVPELVGYDHIRTLGEIRNKDADQNIRNWLNLIRRDVMCGEIVSELYSAWTIRVDYGLKFCFYTLVTSVGEFPIITWPHSAWPDSEMYCAVKERLNVLCGKGKAQRPG